MEIVDGLHQWRSHPHAPGGGSGIARTAIGHPRSLTSLFGTESRKRSLLQRCGSSAWGLRAIFRLAVQDGYIPSNPAELLFVPRIGSRPSRRVLSSEQVQAMLNLLDRREQLIVQLALFSGMRPGEILALQWKHVAGDHVQVVHRVYRGHLDQPKNERSKRTVALSSSTRQLMDQWRRQQGEPADPEGWVFPSAKITTPLGRDSAWRWQMRPRLKAIGLEWVT